MSRAVVVVAFAGISAAARPVGAQALFVQQPVVETFSVGTTVVVPDRGGASLGSVSRAASGRATYGLFPFRGGSAIGIERSHVTSSVHVVVHDFAEMDRLLLDSASGSAASRRPAFTAEAELGSVRRGVASRTAPSPPRVDAAPEPPSPVRVAGASSDSERARRSFDLGRRAEERGALDVARLHYRMASKYGSTVAAERLQSLPTERSASR